MLIAFLRWHITCLTMFTSLLQPLVISWLCVFIADTIDRAVLKCYIHYNYLLVQKSKMLLSSNYSLFLSYLQVSFTNFYLYNTLEKEILPIWLIYLFVHSMNSHTLKSRSEMIFSRYTYTT